MKADALLTALPAGLRDELISEFAELSENFDQGRWRASGLNAGRFCEICYCIIHGLGSGEFPAKASKPQDFPGSCRKLESCTNLPSSFRLIALRILTAVYQVRNDRDIGHVGSAVDPSFMDASFVLSNAKWILAEFIRHFHMVDAKSARSAVDAISQYSSPMVWADDTTRRVLTTDLTVEQRILLLLSSSSGRASRDELFAWLDYSSKSTFNKRVALLHSRRLIEAKAYGREVQILPPGLAIVAEIARSGGSNRLQ